MAMMVPLAPEEAGACASLLEAGVWAFFEVEAPAIERGHEVGRVGPGSRLAGAAGGVV
jgi:hypothetical protein